MKKIKITPVKSSNLKGYHYDKGLKTLTIQFNNGKAYSYFGVPQEVVDGLIKAESLGKFFISNIRGKYEFKSLSYELN